MVPEDTERHSLRVSDDIVVVRTAVRRLAQGLGFSLVDQTKLVTAVSEIARNTIVYGGGGFALVEALPNSGLKSKAGIRLTFADEGPGIVDIEQALTDGWSSGSGLGLGLGGTRRLVDDFHIASNVGEGTTVTFTKWGK